ncbi:MAG: hypothetical protein ACLFTK_12760, partial [Anaerolineales bacterium]
FNTEDTLAQADDTDYAAELATWFDTYAHDFTATAQIGTNGCALETFPVGALGYRIDAFESAEDAEAALADETLTAIQTAQAFSLQEESPLPYAIYTRQTALCDFDDALQIRGVEQVGRYVISTDITVAPDTVPVDAIQEAGILLEQFPLPLFEDLLWPVVLPETR